MEARAVALWRPRVLGAVGDELEWGLDDEDLSARPDRDALSCYQVEIGWQYQDEFEGLWNDFVYVAAPDGEVAETLAVKWMHDPSNREWLGPQPDVFVRSPESAGVIGQVGGVL